jgi:hypothetical protein
MKIMTAPSVSFMNELTNKQSTAPDRQNNACITISSPGLVVGTTATVAVQLINIGSVDAYASQVKFYWQSEWGDTSVQVIDPHFYGQTNPTPGNSVPVSSTPVSFTMKWVPQTIEGGTLYAQALIIPQGGWPHTVPSAPGDPTDCTQVYNAEYTTYII